MSVFKLVQDLLKPSKIKGNTQFQVLLDFLPDNHKARWFADAALNTSEQAMMSVLLTILSKLNAFIDSEIEQILCFETTVDIAMPDINEKAKYAKDIAAGAVLFSAIISVIIGLIIFLPKIFG